MRTFFQQLAPPPLPPPTPVMPASVPIKYVKSPQTKSAGEEINRPFLNTEPTKNIPARRRYFTTNGGFGPPLYLGFVGHETRSPNTCPVPASSCGVYPVAAVKFSVNPFHDRSKVLIIGR
jgi:hypothetical protein